MPQAKVNLELRFGTGWRAVRAAAHGLARVGTPIPAPIMAWLASCFVQVRVDGGRWMKLRATTRGSRG